MARATEKNVRYTPSFLIAPPQCPTRSEKERIPLSSKDPLPFVARTRIQEWKSSSVVVGCVLIAQEKESKLPRTKTDSHVV